MTVNMMMIINKQLYLILTKNQLQLIVIKSNLI